MVSRYLIVRGVITSDDLKQLGLPMAKRYEQADVVALVGEANRGLVVKGSKETSIVEFYDADPAVGRCMRAVHRVREQAEKQDPPHGISKVGFFLYYWPDAPDSVGCVADAIERGDASAVELAADLFIDQVLNGNLGSVLGSAPDEAGNDAAGRAADAATG